MSAQRTPGPWAIEYHNDVGPDDEGFWEWLEVGPARVALASRHDHTTANADARLIAAAPDLLEALKAVLADIARHPVMSVVGATDLAATIAKARVVIAKAEGTAA